MRGVTAVRKSSGKLSGSRNAEPDPDAYDPDTCLYCRTPFAGHMRYPIRFWNCWDHMPDVNFASLCMDCFKQEDNVDCTSRQKRYERPCHGCGEPMLTPLEGVFARQVCSVRCYQRAYRKRRRENGGSTVPWKGSTPICMACKKRFVPTRKDARFCSNACRQRAYRRRLSTGSVGDASQSL